MRATAFNLLFVCAGESLRILYAAAEIMDYRATGVAQERQQRGLALQRSGLSLQVPPHPRGHPLRIDEGDAAAALQEYLQLEAPQSSSTQDLQRLSRLANTLTFSSSAADLLQQNRLSAAACAALDEDSDVASAAAAAAAAAAPAGGGGAPFGRKNLLGSVPSGLPPYLPEDVNACTLMPPWSLTLEDKERQPTLPPTG
ncbi:uncharacterized protein LOC113147191 [Cyclospora cayetanensis]|uniref:Uncharacterized protein LOC113147191 n=1 Tax=Cyclospora cayetanensis TaxID=88456 RepID=A0A6P6RXU4_9EIME|nr:uncharacterized protein LOC113147191 [Cyclospora cayetanensis]